jgi:hypothetical protein
LTYLYYSCIFTSKFTSCNSYDSLLSVFSLFRGSIYQFYIFLNWSCSVVRDTGFILLYLARQWPLNRRCTFLYLICSVVLDTRYTNVYATWSWLPDTRCTFLYFTCSVVLDIRCTSIYLTFSWLLDTRCTFLYLTCLWFTDTRCTFLYFIYSGVLDTRYPYLIVTVQGFQEPKTFLSLTWTVGSRHQDPVVQLVVNLTLRYLYRVVKYSNDVLLNLTLTLCCSTKFYRIVSKRRR